MTPTFSLTINGTERHFDQPIVMGVINCTPDSFYADSRAQLRDEIMGLATKHVEDGATIIDLGAFSTRPGGEAVSAAEELARLREPLGWIVEAFPEIIVSIDTFRASVAAYGLAHGAHIINDISGGRFDPDLLDVVASAHVPYVAMHAQGDVASMHEKYAYSRVERDVVAYFAELVERLAARGIDQVIVDPGFGFSKSMEDNFRLLHRLDALRPLDCPILAGLSRKRMIWQTLDSSPALALNGTTVLNTIALMSGASILRVHDVREAMEAVALVAKTCEMQN